LARVAPFWASRRNAISPEEGLEIVPVEDDLSAEAEEGNPALAHPRSHGVHRHAKDRYSLSH
jgi:hypothetical protein